jgi:ABC-2 type transport system permease protein
LEPWRDPSSSSFTAKDVIALEKRRIASGARTVEFVADRKPAYVGINPYLTLIERETSDNVVALGTQWAAAAG